jgi:catalase
VNSARGFYEQLIAYSPDPATGKPDPAKTKAFLTAHLEAARALALIKKRQVTSGFADSSFNGLNAFRFVDAAGASLPVRWSMVPVQPVAGEAAERSEAGAENYLFDNLIGQIAQHPRQWRLIVTIGQAGDPTGDATQPWPQGRQQIDAGTVTINRASSEDDGRCTAINYDPLVLPTGIEPSDDPLLSARSAAYASSFTLRAEEDHEKPPSAVTPQEVQAGGKS